MKRKTHNGIFYVVISFVAILGIASFVVAYSGYGTPKVVVEGNYIEAQETAPATDSLGAVSGPDLMFPYLSVNSVRHWYDSSPVNVASTTLCSIKSPVATSTLIFASLKINTGTSSLLFVEIGKGSTYQATTTSLGTTSVPAGSQATIIASTTPSGFVDDRDVFAPGKWLVFKGANGIGGFADQNEATCKAEWIEN